MGGAVSDQLAIPFENKWERLARQFHAENPGVYMQLVGYARQAKQAGYSRIGIELPWNRMRWDWMLRTSADGTGFKLNQNYKAFYARLIMEQEPDLAGMFETRRLRAS